MAPDTRNAAPALPEHLTGYQRFVLDPDIALECDDRAQASGCPTWAEWLETTVNEALRAHLFG